MTLNSPQDLPLNQEFLATLSDGDHEFEQELLWIFLEDAQLRLNLLQQALATQNLAQISFQAHQLKGASANIGAETLTTLAHQLEQTPQALTIPALEQIHHQLVAVQEFVTFHYGNHPS